MKHKACLWILVILGLVVSLYACDRKSRDRNDRDTSEMSRPASSRPMTKSKQQLKQEAQAIAKVQSTPTAKGFSLKQAIQFFHEFSAVEANKHGWTIPSGFTWSANCKSEQTCEVRLEFWDHKELFVALWEVDNNVTPKNFWAYGLMQRLSEYPNAPDGIIEIRDAGSHPDLANTKLP
jgi:hypothetical protein